MLTLLRTFFLLILGSYLSNITINSFSFNRIYQISQLRSIFSNEIISLHMSSSLEDFLVTDEEEENVEGMELEIIEDIVNETGDIKIIQDMIKEGEEKLKQLQMAKVIYIIINRKKY